MLVTNLLIYRHSLAFDTVSCLVLDLLLYCLEHRMTGARMRPNVRL